MYYTFHHLIVELKLLVGNLLDIIIENKLFEEFDVQRIYKSYVISRSLNR